MRLLVVSAALTAFLIMPAAAQKVFQQTGVVSPMNQQRTQPIVEPKKIVPAQNGQCPAGFHKINGFQCRQN